MGPSWDQVVSSWRQVGLSWGSWRHLEVSWKHLVSKLDQVSVKLAQVEDLGAHLEPKAKRTHPGGGLLRALGEYEGVNPSGSWPMGLKRSAPLQARGGGYNIQQPPALRPKACVQTSSKLTTKKASRPTKQPRMNQNSFPHQRKTI